MAIHIYSLPYYNDFVVDNADDSFVLVLPDSTLFYAALPVELTGNGARAQVLGTVATASFYAIALGSEFNARAGADLYIGPRGLVTTSDKGFVCIAMNTRDFDVANDGSIYSPGYALYVAPGGNTAAGDSSIVNTGRIFGKSAGIVTSYDPLLDDLRIDNVGLIRSAVDAIALAPATGAITLVNTGRIIGDVRLGSGADLFVGRDGLVDGRIFLNGGNDTARPGLEDEWIDGGSGTADTLDFRGRSGVQVSLANDIGGSGPTAGDTYTGFENVSGTRGGDTIIGDAAANLLRGEAGADSMLGGSGNDTLLGGLGKDTLNGGANNDVFQWNASTEGGDTVVDFTNAAGNDDRLFFAAAGFAGLVAGPLPAGAYIVRADNAAQQADDRFVFRTTDRTLWFDSDGNGAGAATLIATFGGATVPTAADFTVF